MPPRRFRARSLLVLLAVPLGLAAPASALAADAPVVPGQVIVRFAPDRSAATQAKALDAVDARGSTPIALPDTRVVRLDHGASVAEAVDRLEQRRDVLWAEPNYVVTVDRTPSDPRLPEQWGVANVGQALPMLRPNLTMQAWTGTAGVDLAGPAAWDATSGSSQVLVGVMDTGIARHPDLDANLREDLSRDFRAHVGGPADPTADANGHGTHVAGTIGAVGDNARGVAGVSWNVGLVALRVLDAGSGTTADLAQAYVYAGQAGLPIVNASLGGPANQATADAIAASPDTLFVVAAGNDGADNDVTPTYPCTLPYENVICVASLDNDGALSWYSNRGHTQVDLAAPGNGVLSTYPDYLADPLPVGASDWTHGGAQDEWTVEPDGTLVSNPDGTLNAGADAAIATTHPVSLTGRRGCIVSASVELGNGTDPADPAAILQFERSIDGGATWDPIGVAWQNTVGHPQPMSFGLQADGASNVLIGMRLQTGDTVVLDGADTSGARVTDPSVRCLAPGEPDTYRVSAGTSMATPHVAGVAALLLAKRPDLTVAQLRHALLSTVVPMPSLAGTTVTGGRVDAAAALASVAPAAGPAQTPSAGPAPSPGSPSAAAPQPAPTPSPTLAPLPAPAAGAAPRPASAPTATPSAAPVLLRLPRVARLSSRGTLTAEVTFRRRAALRATATVRWPGGSVALRPYRRTSVAAGRTITVRLTADPTVRARIERSRRAGRAMTVRIRLVVTPAGGRRYVVHHSARLR